MDLLKEFRESMKEDIKEAVAAAFGNRKPAHSMVVASDGDLTVDPTIVAVVPGISSSTANDQEVLEVVHDAFFDCIAPAPTSCSTNGLNQNVDGDDHIAAWQATWSVPTPLKPPQEASPTPSLRLFVVLELVARAPTRCLIKGSVKVASAVMPQFTQGAGSRVESRPLPWPSFACNQVWTLLQFPSSKLAQVDVSGSNCSMFLPVGRLQNVLIAMLELKPWPSFLVNHADGHEMRPMSWPPHFSLNVLSLKMQLYGQSLPFAAPLDRKLNDHIAMGCKFQYNLSIMRWFKYEVVLVIVSEQFQCTIAWVIQLRCLELWDFHPSTPLQPTVFHAYSNKGSAYSSWGMVVTDTCTMLYDRELLQWEIAWIFRMSTLQLELLLCTPGQGITAKACVHMTWNSGGLASAILGTQCYVLAYCGALGNHCSCYLLPGQFWCLWYLKQDNADSCYSKHVKLFHDSKQWFSELCAYTITVALVLDHSCFATTVVHLCSYRLLIERPCRLIAARASLCATLKAAVMFVLHTTSSYDGKYLLVHAALRSFWCELFPTTEVWSCWQGECYNQLPSYEGPTVCQLLICNEFSETTSATTKSEVIQAHLSSPSSGIIVNGLCNLRAMWCQDHVLLRIEEWWLDIQGLLLADAFFETSFWPKQHIIKEGFASLGHRFTDASAFVWLYSHISYGQILGVYCKRLKCNWRIQSGLVQTTFSRTGAVTGRTMRLLVEQLPECIDDQLVELLEEKLNEMPKCSVTPISCESGYKLHNTSFFIWRTSAVCVLLCCYDQFQWKLAGLLFYHLSNCCPVTLLRLPVSANCLTLMYAAHKNQIYYMKLSHSNHCQEGINLKVEQIWCAITSNILDAYVCSGELIQPMSKDFSSMCFCRDAYIQVQTFHWYVSQPEVQFRASDLDCILGKSTKMLELLPTSILQKLQYVGGDKNCGLQTPWDPGGEKFFEYFMQTEAKGGRNNKSAPYCADQFSCLDLTCSFKQVPVHHKFYFNFDQVRAGNNDQLCDAASFDLAHVYFNSTKKCRVSWDPGDKESAPASAWGQDEIQGGRGVSNRPLLGLGPASEE